MFLVADAGERARVSAVGDSTVHLYTRRMLTGSAVRASIRESASRALGVDASAIPWSADLLADVLCSSVQLIDLVLEVEKAFGVAFSADEAERLRSLDAIEAVLHDHLQARGLPRKA
jgi:acyl carrier protein